jgi:hypothetical protein
VKIDYGLCSSVSKATSLRLTGPGNPGEFLQWAGVFSWPYRPKPAVGSTQSFTRRAALECFSEGQVAGMCSCQSRIDVKEVWIFCPVRKIAKSDC